MKTEKPPTWGDPLTSDSPRVAHGPVCNHCGRTLEQGVSWPNISACRLSFLLPLVADCPGLSAAELSNASGLDYKATSSAMAKARELAVVISTPEDRGDGTMRYRFEASPDWEQRVRRAHEFVGSSRELTCPDCGNIRPAHDFRPVMSW